MTMNRMRLRNVTMAVIKETMRIHTVVPLIQRYASEDMPLACLPGKVAPKGSMVCWRWRWGWGKQRVLKNGEG